MRYVLLDRITALEPPDGARGIKCVSLSDDIFADHFPGHPVMPGALILEALAQLGGVLCEATMRLRGRDDLHALLVADRAGQVPPHGAARAIGWSCEARACACSEDGGQVRATAHVDGQLAAEAELTFAFAEVKHPKLIERRREVLNVWLHGSSEEP